MIYIKKIVLVLTLCLFLWGCESKEVTVNHPNGDSLTYKFFNNSGYDADKYTLKLKKGNRDITIIHDGDKTYYEVSDENGKLITIEKDNFKYKLNDIDKSYTKEEISSYTNYGLGYVPFDMKKLKTLKYKKGKEKKGIFTYTYEKYVYNGGITIYYFRGKNLKYIKNVTSLDENEVKFVSISSKIDKNKFNIPKEYMELEF